MKEDELRVVLNKELAGFFGKLHLRIDTVEQKLDSKADSEQVNRLQNSIDGLAKRIDTDDAERGAANNQLNRHNDWIGQLADSTHNKTSIRV